MQSKPNSVTEEVVKRLAVFLKSAMPDLKQILEEFPEASENLDYPSISIFAGEPTHRPQAPVLVHQDDVVAPAKIKTKYIVGEYEWKFQIDLWASSKKQRHDLYQKFYDAFSNRWPIMGLSLTLSEYHDVICSYDITGYRFDDSEAGSQRKEWRAKIAVMANCDAIKARDEFAILQTEVTVETKDIAESDLDLV